MSIKGYLDGTGKLDTVFMGLAAIAAPCDAWMRFQDAWEQVLQQYQVPYSHMKDLNSFNEPFTKSKGWCQQRANEFVNDLLSVLYPLLREPAVCPRITVVPVVDHDRAQALMGNLPTIPCLCAYWCLNQICGFYEDGERFELVFDRREPFFHQINRHWEKKPFAKRHERLSRIDALDQADMETVTPLQAADLLAWEINRLWRTGVDPAYRFKPGFGKLEAEWLLLSTQNQRWEYVDLEYLAQCRNAPTNPEMKMTADLYSLCFVR